MIFFMVKIANFYMLNVKSDLLAKDEIIKDESITDNKFDVKVASYNNNNPKNNHDEPSKYTKVLVKDPYNNRNIILKMTKKQKGVYV